MNEKPIWKMVQDSAQELTQKGTVPFTRNDLIESIHQHSPNCDPNSINPIIQGITDNLKGGAPGAAGKNILHKVRWGRFVLCRQGEESVSLSPTTRTPPNQHESDLAGSPSTYTPATENELRDYILDKLTELLRNRSDIQLVAEGRLEYGLPGDHTLKHASDILAIGSNDKHVSIELKYKSAVTDQFKCRAYDTIHMKKEYGEEVLCVMVFVKTKAGISIKHADRICYCFDHFIGIPAAEIGNTPAWEELADRISTFL